MTVFVLGAGRAGRGLADAFRDAGLEVVGVHGRRAEQGITAGPIPLSARQAQVVIVAVRDAQLDDALHELLATLGTPATGADPAVVLHLSGNATPVALVDVRAAGYAAGTFHPLVPLAEPSRAAARLRGAWIGVDGNAAAVVASRALAERLGAHILLIPEGAKPLYHAAAVLSSNFPAVLAALAVKLMGSAGVPPTAARRAVDALLRASVANLEGADPTTVLTGPVVRGDVGTVRAHLDALASDPTVDEVYRALSRAAVSLLRDHDLGDPARLDEIGKALDRKSP
jgi:predicted short-subunit dehydrogenase-like oxidoreductase (DUF2520 family)